jgi:hypothetical protein
MCFLTQYIMHRIFQSFVSVCKELYYLYCSTNCYSGGQSRIRWAGHVARMGDRRGAYRVLMGRPEGKHSLEDVGADGRIILKRIFRRCDEGRGLD